MSSTKALGENPTAPRANRAERLLIPATFITNLGNGIQLTAAAYLVFTEASTMLAVSWLMIAVTIPQVALSLWFGKIADRFDRRTLALISDLISAAAAVALPLWLYLDGEPTTVSYVASFVLALSAALFFPASNALIKERIPESRLAQFNGNAEIAIQAGTLASAAIGGWVIAWVGVNSLFYFNAVTFLISAAMLFALGRRPAAAPQTAEEKAASAASAAAAKKAGVRPPLARLGLLYAIGNIVIIVGNSILLVLVIDGFNSSVGILGVVDALFGIGALFAAAAFKKFSARSTVTKAALIGYLAFAVILVLETTHLWIMMAVIPLAGLTFGMARISARTALMTASPEERTGFVFGATNAFGLAAGTTATVLISLLVDATDVRYGFYVLAGLVAVIAVVTVTSLTRTEARIRKAEAAGSPAVAETTA
ncbi:MFS transporter [Streptomyces purpureus]|uniref:MFS-type transporter YfiS n=1 Tax=Streptomyces purpureus TaxID=1951 RepID=A0A918GWY4_9ACTN|nr:MFS transporter [Streptomyces purpureus]GGT12453.1 putative MFS-type transporter YfiS [Streptomyces purpureus]